MGAILRWLGKFPVYHLHNLWQPGGQMRPIFGASAARQSNEREPRRTLQSILFLAGQAEPLVRVQGFHVRKAVAVQPQNSHAT